MWAWVGVTPSRREIPPQEERRTDEKARMRKTGRASLHTLGRDGFMAAGLLSGPDRAPGKGRGGMTGELCLPAGEKTMISLHVVGREVRPHDPGVRVGKHAERGEIR
jgi:hypothetical protein